ncbi:MAG: hypothetical protein H6825_04410 [Planctomycetes bacterium]|nr:hypothetical protein [Planctomycetota bacterium]
MTEDDDAPRTFRALLRDGGRPLAALLFLALFVKLLCVAAALSDDPLARLATSDSRYYLERAAGLAGRVDDPLAAEPYHMPPLYPQFLARVPGALDGSFGGVMVVQALGGVVLLAGTWLVARRRLSRHAALVACALTLLYAPLTFFETKLLGDSLAACGFVLLVAIGDALAVRASAARGFGTGLLTGGLALLRPQALLLAPVLALWAGRRSRPAGVSLLLGAALAVAPATLHNLQTGGGLVLVSDNGGVNLWLANTGPLSGTFATHDEAFGDIARQAEAASALAQRETGRRLSAGEVSDWFARAALSAVLDDPLRFLQRVGLRARALLETFETGIVAIPEVEMRLVPPLGVLVLPFGVLLALAGASLALGLPRRLRARPALPALALAGMVALTALVFFHYSRFRLPVVPLLAILAAAPLDRLAERPAPARWLLALLAAASLAALSWWPGPHRSTTLANGWTSVADARLALAHDPDDVARAQRDVERALAVDGGFARALLLDARIDLMLLRFDACDARLDELERFAGDVTAVMEQRVALSVHPHPGNTHRDEARARALLDDLRLRALDDPALAERLVFLESMLPPR